LAATDFLTGGAGFVGTRLLEAISRRTGTVIALDRSGSVLREPHKPSNVRVVSGDLLDPGSYQQALTTADVAVHLAASTGKATQEEHYRAIVSATDALIEQCRRAGVRKFLYVSSIAATFPDTRHYYYAQAKIKAEASVRGSGLAFAIVRPTMILGPGSPIFSALRALATLPVVPVFGNGRTRVQPVSVEDVVRSILAILNGDMFTNDTFEVGGPDVLTMEELLQRIRQAAKGHAGRVLHLPLGLLTPPLLIAEAMGIGRLLPVNAGQLASFRQDGVVTANPLQDHLRPMLRPVDQMITSSLQASDSEGSVTDRECATFTRYLAGLAASPYVRRKYAEAHSAVALEPKDPFDQLLLRFARKGPLLAKLADAYARIFYPHATLRRKLVLLLAILETCPPSYRVIDSTVGRRKAGVLLQVALRGTLAVLGLAVASIVLIPARLAVGSGREKTPQ
jgi:NADH dehydrogenase